MNDCQDEDVRTATTLEALHYITKRVARGAMLERAFMKGAGFSDPHLRFQELTRCVSNLERVVGLEGFQKKD